MMRTNRRKRKKNQLFRRCHIWRPHIRNTIYVCSVAVCSGYKCVVHIVSGWKYGIRHADVGNVWCESFFFTALVNLSTRNAILMFFYMHGMRFPSHTENTVCVRKVISWQWSSLYSSTLPLQIQISLHHHYHKILYYHTRNTRIYASFDWNYMIACCDVHIYPFQFVALCWNLNDKTASQNTFKKK